MTLDEIAALQPALEAQLYKNELKEFILKFWPVLEPTSPFQAGYHTDAICDHLSHLRDFRNLLIAMPPRHGKSSIVAVLWFAWEWITNPSARFIFSSYSLQLSTRDSVRSRRLLESPEYQAYWKNAFKLTTDQNTKQRFENDKTGCRLAVSTEGSMIGEGGDFLICDDPLNLVEAESLAAREACIRWYSNVFSTRLNDPATGCRVIVSQRCHVDDLIGWILKNDQEQDWTKLILPLEGGKCKFTSTRFHDARKEGQLLSKRIPPKEVKFLKSQLGSRAFNAQYNQNPAPSEDALFNPDDIRYYDTIPEGGMRIAAVDLAISLKGDYTVIAIAQVMHDGNIYLLHLHRERMPGPRLVPTIKQLHQIYEPQVIYCEDTSFQRLVIQECRQQGLPVRPVKAEGDKISRSINLQVKMENRQLWLPENKSFLSDLLEELQEFPNASHDDQVDALSYLCNQANLLQKRITAPTRTLSQEEQHRQEDQEFNQRVQEDYEAYRNRFFSGAPT